LKRDLLVRIDTDDKHVPELSRAGEITDVSHVQHIETSVS
jgi:hypothetical protein